MFSQFNDRLSSLEDIVTSLHANILEIKEENTKLKSQIASLLPKPLEDEPTVESFMFKPAFENPAEDEPAIASKPAAVAPEPFMFKPAFENPAEDEPAIASKPPTEVFMSVLKRVPHDKRKFFDENIKSTKYYYRVVGNTQYDPNRNTLVPLGTILELIVDRYNAINDKCRFSCQHQYEPPFPIGYAEFVYTDEPPGEESAPLHYYDYIQLTCPSAFDENGRPNPLYAEMFPTAFGDGVTGWGVQMVNYHETEQLRNSRLGAANFIAKKTYV
jgi:hypothetical protein